MGIKNGRKIVETGRLDLKKTTNANLVFFRSFLGLKFGTVPSGGGGGGWAESGIKVGLGLECVFATRQPESAAALQRVVKFGEEGS